MSDVTTLIEEPIAAENSNDLRVTPPTLDPEGATEPRQPIHFKAAGFVLPPFDPDKAIAALDALCEGDPEEQRETFEYLKRALNETRAANGHADER
ncbi:MAG: hypothetical protein ACREEM_36265 [Blastocatellia bacterium]